MPQAVTSRARRIARPRPADDRIQPLRLGLLAGACFALGLGASVWNAGGERLARPAPAPRAARAAASPAGAPERASEGAEAAAPEPSVSAEADAGAPAFVLAEGAAAAALVAGTAEADAGREVPTATPFDGARRVEPGRVAYLRCAGVPQRPGPYPCPRDEALETAVWAVLDTLPRCADAPPGLGESDVRLELVAGAPTEVKLRAPRPTVPRLDGQAVLRCAAGPLSHVATTTGATKLVLSFRFALVDARQPRAR